MNDIIPTLLVADIEASIKFYSDALGFEATFTMPGEDGELMHASIQRGASMVMFGPLRHLPPDDRHGLGRGVSLYAMVADDEDIDALYERARAAGAKIVQEPTDQFWGHRNWGIADLDGYVTYVAKEIRLMSRDQMREAGLAAALAD